MAQQPEFKGGLERFVASNTIYPSYALYNCIQGSVRVSFKINDAGHSGDPDIVKEESNYYSFLLWQLNH